MKRIFALLLSVLLVLPLAACGSDAPETLTAAPADGALHLVEPGKLTVATEATFPPYEMPASDGEGVAGTGLTGVDIDLAAAIADRLGLELVVQDMPFDHALFSPQNGKADLVIAGISATAERERMMLFSEPYCSSVQVVVVPTDSGIKDRDDLREARLGAVAGTTSWLYSADEFGADAVTVFEGYADARAALESGAVDALILEQTPAEALLESAPAFQMLEKPFSEEDYAIGMASDNYALRTAVDQALAELEADGTLREILARYIPSDPV